MPSLHAGSLPQVQPSRPAGASLSVRLLGPVGLAVEGAPVAPVRPMEMLLAARLALSLGEIVPVTVLIDALWDEAPPATSRKILQKYVSSLRKRLGTETIRSDRHGYAMSVSKESVDVFVFDRMLADARAALRRGEASRAWRHYADALALWRGAPFTGLTEAAFVVEERARLEELKLSALEEQMEVGLAIGKHDDLVAPLTDLVRRHPFRERLWAALMTALYCAGRQADALAAYRDVQQTLRDELGIEPSRALKELEGRVLTHDPALGPSTRERADLPVSFTSFVGRTEDIAALTELLEASRLVTLTGPGGSGKTRLALELARCARSSHPDGTFFVDLSATSDPADVAGAAASTFGLVPEPGADLERALLDSLENRRVLLVLDNCEHLTAAAAALAAAILRSGRAPKVLATSREPLGLAGEVIYPVEPLAVPSPEDLERLTEIPAARLFLDRAEAADPGFRLTPALAPIVTEICRVLDGIPLAIELAARQLHVVGADDLRTSLLDRLDLLAAPGDPDARHRTMETAIEWSYRLLDDEERAMFEAVSVFPGTFSADAAGVVAAPEAGPGSAVRILAGLVGHSMVQRQERDGLARYRLLEPVRAYATGRASLAGRARELRRAHGRWVLELFEANAPVVGPGERERLRLLVTEHHHLTAALDWATVNDAELALRILVAAAQYTQMVVYRFGWAEDANLAIAAGGDVSPSLRAAALARGAQILAENLAAYETVKSWSDSALAIAEMRGEHETAGIALLALGWAHRNAGILDEAKKLTLRAIAIFEGDDNKMWAAHGLHSLTFSLLSAGKYEEATEVCERSLALWEELGSDWGAGKAWWHIAAAAASRGDYETADDAARRSLELFEGFDDPGSIVHVRGVLGDAARFAGRWERAEAIYRTCLAGFQEVGDRRCTASALRNLGVVVLHRGRVDEAVRLLAASLERRQRLQDLAGVLECLEGLAVAALRRDDDALSVRLMAAAERLRSTTGAGAPEPDRAEINAVVAELRSRFTSTRFDALWDEGRHLATEEAIAQARTLAGAAPENP